jgi:hypothetical protein
MSARPEPDADRVTALARRYGGKVAAELDAADLQVPGTGPGSSSGDRFASVMLVKGFPGPAELSGGPVLSGADGVAARKALEALGFDPGSVFCTLSRPAGTANEEAVRRRLRLQVEAVDPRVVVALDDEAARDVESACGLRRLKPGVPDHNGPRAVLAVSGFESSLTDPGLKRAVWRQFRALKPPAAVW